MMTRQGARAPRTDRKPDAAWPPDACGTDITTPFVAVLRRAVSLVIAIRGCLSGIRDFRVSRRYDRNGGAAALPPHTAVWGAVYVVGYYAAFR